MADVIGKVEGSAYVAAVLVNAEPVGEELTATGIVREIYPDGSASVDFPATGGGALGVQLAVPDGTKPGDLFSAAMKVTAADALSVTLEIPTALGDVQKIQMDGRGRGELLAGDVVPPPAPVVHG